MKVLGRFLAASALSAALSCGAILAQDHSDDQHYVRHDEWKKGYHMKDEDWHRGTPVDYRSHYLKAPPRGYEWREVDGNYVLAAAATGVIASVIAASAAH